MSEASSSKVKADSLLPPAKSGSTTTASTPNGSTNSASSLATKHGIELPTQEDAERLGFNVFSHILDPRLLRALADLGFGIPTPIQQKAIPLALAGKDVLARARTGSGKTLAYGLPLLQKVLDAKNAVAKSDTKHQLTRALVLVPTRELAEQVFRHLSAIIEYVRDDVRLVNVAREASEKVQRLLLSEKPDVVIATPSKALNYLQNGSLDLKSGMESLAIDEADLILSYGHDSDVKSLLSGNFLPSHFQSFLMSATMTSDVSKLKGLLLRNPVILKLNEDDEAASGSNLVQFYTKTTEEDKFLLVYVILKLKLIRGKAILFVNELERGYRLKLFLEKFGLRACVLNAELPINSRYSIVEEFNKGRFDYIVATDEPTGLSAQPEEDGPEDAEVAAEDDEAGEEAGEEGTGKKRKSTSEAPASSKKSKNKRKKGKNASNEYGVSRGVDFVNVSCVINFDLPTSVDSYIHRVGRTARGGASGTALSFVVPSAEVGRSKYLTCPTTRYDESVFKQLTRTSSSSLIGGPLQEWNYDSTSVSGFRYRVTDTLKSITKALIREARIKELKNEILTSTKLQSHFEDHPDDLAFLQHDKALLGTRAQQSHLKHVPQYLVPKIINPGAKLTRGDTYKGYVPKNKVDGGKGKNGKGKGKGRSSTGKGATAARGKKKVDPLRKFAKK
ncbi:DNA/RNA helicase, DEAD/DEAH box type, N-terminal [Kalmanozyma brasiliensis GHG001]|uniref:RNA helicase n=1 Tax=Kalmanozyma brasiliensis (strain GHG001) TaxID=1365824 RepID=V5GEL0_KALBG|nr:DNA/RNA helicase, DEAD/DEAH box type, N-terminal [Kalmanozyma brasiliensis GHG001]EST04487.1 DNA/RNA helicase, DEAD/DEAH box type, N-terminal [Kalmanozyma brasiliensis GHG001]